MFEYLGANALVTLGYAVAGAILAVIVGVWYRVHGDEHPFLGNLLTGDTWPLAWGRLAGLIAAWALTLC
jgi:hypothetical protein